MTDLRSAPPFAPGDADPPEDFDALRASIPACDDTAYFNTGATGPSPRFVLDAAADWSERHKVDALVDADPYVVGFDAYDACRERIADFLDVDPVAVGLTESTGDGLSALLAALEWSDGDAVVTTDLEHPAADLPIDRLRRERGVEVRTVETDRGRIDVDDVAAAAEGARAVVVSSLSWTYGTRLPVADLVDAAHDAGALAIVDAVQSPGQHPIDLDAWGADAVVASGHKWLLGVWGSGMLYLDPAVSDRFAPPQVSYRGVADPGGGYEPAAGAARFERGTASIAPHVALVEGLRAFEALGVDAVEREVSRLTQRLVDALPGDRLLSPDPPESGLVTLTVDDPETTVETLRGEGFAIRDLSDPHAVRASVHAFNTEREVDALAAALTAA